MARCVSLGAAGFERKTKRTRKREFLDEMKAEVLSKYDILTVGETPGVTTQHALGLTDEQDGALSMVFQFEHMHLDAAPEAGSSRRSTRAAISSLNGEVTLSPRIPISRAVSSASRAESAARRV